MSAALIAPAGTGKTALLRHLRSVLPEPRYYVQYVKVTGLSKRDMCREIAVGIMTKTAAGVAWVSRVTLTPESSQRPTRSRACTTRRTRAASSPTRSRPRSSSRSRERAGRYLVITRYASTPIATIKIAIRMYTTAFERDGAATGGLIP